LTAKQYLEPLRHADCELSALLCRLNQLVNLSENRADIMDAATHITPSFGDHVQGDPAASKVESGAIRLADLDSKEEIAESIRGVNRRIADLEARKKKAEEIIWGLCSNSYRAVLTYRYINNMRWESIADAMHYGTRSIQRLNGYALQEFGRSEMFVSIALKR